MAESVGYRIERSVGNDGTFYYPKLDLLATTMLLADVHLLTYAEEGDRSAILKIRNQANLVRLEQLRRKEIEIHYETQIPFLEAWDLQAALRQVKKRGQMNNHPDGVDINVI